MIIGNDTNGRKFVSLPIIIIDEENSISVVHNIDERNLFWLFIIKLPIFICGKFNAFGIEIHNTYNM